MEGLPMGSSAAIQTAVHCVMSGKEHTVLVWWSKGKRRAFLDVYGELDDIFVESPRDGMFLIFSLCRNGVSGLRDAIQAQQQLGLQDGSVS